ncbi:MAG: 30S ribosomal protein S17 [Gammaproteobacteria bacterium]|nr:30S ribosomal protein S17 [Gammaproteobacteria bacterium]
MADVEQKQGLRTITGTVVSNKGSQTITLLVERRVAHETYGKIIRRSSKVRAHDPKDECNVGDVVTVRASRPISKTKHWILDRIESRGTSAPEVIES